MAVLPPEIITRYLHFWSRIRLRPPDDRGNCVLAETKVARDPAIAAALSDERQHFGGEPVGFRAIAGPPSELSTSCPCSSKTGANPLAEHVALELRDWLLAEAEQARSNDDLARRFIARCRDTMTILPAITTIERPAFQMAASVAGEE